MKIYIASPLGFSEIWDNYYESKIKPEIEKLGFEILCPWKENDTEELRETIAMDFSMERFNKFKKLNEEIGERNRILIDDSDILLAVLDGTDVDSGTSAEIGYACAKEKKIIGYRGDWRRSGDNEASIVNLQVEYFIKYSGGDIYKSFEEILEVLESLIKAN